MIPLKNLDPRRSFPFLTIALIVANFVVFFHQISLPAKAADAFIYHYGLVPARVSEFLASARHVSAADAFLPFFTCMFLHGGWLHILGNMWFLWIFGANVEDRLGGTVYLLFYFVCGLFSGVTQTVFSWGSHIPSVGASGAIAGVLGAFIVFFPRSRILTLVPLIVFWFLARIPAVVFIGLWFVVQFFSGVSSLSVSRASEMGGVAWWAHVGGFMMGAILALVVNGASGGQRRRSAYYEQY
ncbi:MAG TPA: rhomboid family intramembrane serine protease [Candidatus Acidoferrum sp.]|nr:rhomboid family intramembrane serine protease [Candidatus Acidoferrum sp.]